VIDFISFLTACQCYSPCMFRLNKFPFSCKLTSFK